MSLYRLLDHLCHLTFDELIEYALEAEIVKVVWGVDNGRRSGLDPIPRLGPGISAEMREFSVIQPAALSQKQQEAQGRSAAIKKAG